MMRWICVFFWFANSASMFGQTGEDRFGGYSDKTSYFPGDTVKFYISVDRPQFSLRIFRYGVRSFPSRIIQSVQGGAQSIPDSAYWYGCFWKQKAHFIVPQDWPTGVYLGEFQTLAGTLKRVIFVIKNPSLRNDMLFVISTNTYQLYNNFGGKSGYDFNSTDGKRSFKMSFLRPYTGLGDGHFTDIPYNRASDWYVPKTAWEAITVKWLESNGYRTDYCSDTDMDNIDSILSRYKVILISGHSEYWSKNMRDKAERFLNNGGKIVFLSGNTCWMQVRYEDNYQTLVCYKNKDIDPMYQVADSLVTVPWPFPPVNRRTNVLTGVNWEEGGVVNYVNNNIRILPADSGYGGYVVLNPSHWVFADTRLKMLDRLGQNSAIVGYETDGYKKIYWEGYPFGFIGPWRFRVLGAHPAKNFDGSRRGFATMGIFYNDRGGCVFNAATTNWSHGFFNDKNVEQITMNVLDRFIESSIPPDIIDFKPRNSDRPVVMGDTFTVRKPTYVVRPGDSILFEIAAFDLLRRPMRTYWTENDVTVANRYYYTFRPTNMKHGEVKTVRVYVSSGLDTSSTWATVKMKKIEITSPVDTIAYTRSHFIYPVRAISYDNKPLRFRFVEKPNWMSFDSVNRRIYGTPAVLDYGNTHFSFSFFDPDGNADTLRVKLKISLDAQLDSSNQNNGIIILPNYPNPFNGSTQLVFLTRESGTVKAHIYNSIGQEICSVFHKQVSSGVHSVLWDGKNNVGNSISSGVYYFKVDMNSNENRRYTKVQRIMFLK